MNGFPAFDLAADARRVGAHQRAVVAAAAGDAFAGAADDPPQLLDVDMNQLAGPGAFVALRGLQAQAAEPAHPDPLENPRDRRDW